MLDPTVHSSTCADKSLSVQIEVINISGVVYNIIVEDYKEILEQSIDGRIIIANYKKETKLNRQLRSKLVDVIITHLMSLFCSEQGWFAPESGRKLSSLIALKWRRGTRTRDTTCLCGSLGGVFSALVVLGILLS
ncbi:PREDICTED: uncharacterized protein LOC105448216 [Wasmannia auropunctata]|uniref:uncharacterized protein LOC105448216 n=1 Tax=Wasmannia auropunctata TaxID=64793 RepID=UPI0005F03724|nr:PREDICTED: uncharacterized protein LOC105448216 [Wasmannia auropunctata]